jgi:hypothetical protein
MKTMKKSTITLMLCGLLLMLVMYNCKKKDEPFPDKPDQGKVEEINKIEVAPIVPTTPAPVTTTASGVTVSAQAVAVNNDLAAAAASGTVPASVTAAATTISTAFTPTEKAALGAVTPQVIAAIAAGGAPSPELKAILDKAAANPAVAAYLPKITLPTVGGQAIGGRTAAAVSEKTEVSDVAAAQAVEEIEVTDACLAAAEAAFQTVKTKLDASKATADAAIATTYAAGIAPLAGNEASCKAGLPAKYATLRSGVELQINNALASAQAAQAVLGPDLYTLVIQLINLTAISSYASLNTLQAADSAACTAVTTATTASLQAARDADLAKSTANYATALAAASVLRSELAQSCHNQGGGN